MYVYGLCLCVVCNCDKFFIHKWLKTSHTVRLYIQFLAGWLSVDNDVISQ